MIDGMHRIPDHHTSVNAARGVRRFTLREVVTDFAREATFVGITDGDLKDQWPEKPESSLRKRRTELAQENVLLETGQTRRNRHGQDEKVWVHRDYHPSPPPVQERDTTPKQSKVARLEALVADLSDMVVLALPYVEEASTDDHYSLEGRARIRKLAARMAAAVSN